MRVAVDDFASRMARPCGVAPGNFGHAVQPSSLVRLQDMPVSVGADSSVEGRIVVVDRFGNLLTNIRGSSVPEKFDLEIGGHLVREHFNHYAADDWAFRSRLSGLQDYWKSQSRRPAQRKFSRLDRAQS